MRTWSAVFLSVIVMIVATPSAANDPQEERNVLSTLNALSEANIKQDRQALGTLIHDGVSYGHTTGEIMTKAIVVDYMLSRDTIVWRWEKPVVTLVGATALVRGTNIVQLRDRESKRITNVNNQQVLWVLVKGNGPHGWQIVARQNFVPRVPAPAASTGASAR